MPAPIASGLALYSILSLVIGAAALGRGVTRTPGRRGRLMAKALGGADVTPPALGARVFLKALPWYLLVRALGLVEIGLLLWLLGFGVDAAASGFVDGALTAAGTIGFMVPQAVGVFEGTSAFLFTTLGYAGEAGVVFALARRARLLLVTGIGVALHWAGRDWRDRKGASSG
jgi:hypothetical protein